MVGHTSAVVVQPTLPEHCHCGTPTAFHGIEHTIAQHYRPWGVWALALVCNTPFAASVTMCIV